MRGSGMRSWGCRRGGLPIKGSVLAVLRAFTRRFASGASRPARRPRMGRVARARGTRDARHRRPADARSLVRYQGTQRVGLAPAESFLQFVRALPAGGWLAFGTVGGRPIVARYIASGNLDPVFGSGGVLPLDALPPQNAYPSFELDAAGRYVVGASGPACVVDPCVYRLLPDGSLDVTFKNAGTAALPPGNPGAKVQQILPLPGGGLLVAGQTTGGTGVLRLLADGTIDAAFGTNGITVFPARSVGFFGSPLSSPTGLRAASTAGYYLATSNYPSFFPYLRQPDLFRFDSSGDPDASFGTGGTLALLVDGTSFGEIEELPAGKFVGLLTVNTGGGSGNHVLFRFDGTGMLDAGFGVGGKADSGVLGFPLGTGPAPRFARVGARYLVPGALGTKIALARMNADGSPDLNFGTGGIISPGAYGRANAVAVGIGGEVLAIGSESPSVSATLHVDAGGAASSQRGAVALPLIDVVASTVVSTSGKLAAIGNAYVTGSGGAIAMLDASGVPIPGFGARGHVAAADLGLSGAEWAGGAFQTDGKLVVGGQLVADNVLVRLDSSGAPDTTFAGSGILQYQSNAGPTRTDAVAVQPDERVVAATTSQSGAFVAIHRWSSLGVPDAGFGVNGEADLAGTLPFLNISAIMFPGGGKMLVAGVAQTVEQLSVVRHAPALERRARSVVRQRWRRVRHRRHLHEQPGRGGPPSGRQRRPRRRRRLRRRRRAAHAGRTTLRDFRHGRREPLVTGTGRMSIVVTAAGDTLVAASDPDANRLMMRIMGDGRPDPALRCRTAPGVSLHGSAHRHVLRRPDHHRGNAALRRCGSAAARSGIYGRRSIAHSATTHFRSLLWQRLGSVCAAAPCRTLAKALAGTARGGEVFLLDSADFGAAIIVSSVSIVAPQNARPADFGRVRHSSPSRFPRLPERHRRIARPGGVGWRRWNPLQQWRQPSSGKHHCQRIFKQRRLQCLVPAGHASDDSRSRTARFSRVGTVFRSRTVAVTSACCSTTSGWRATRRASSSRRAAPRCAIPWLRVRAGHRHRVAGAGGVPLTATLDRVTISGVVMGSSLAAATRRSPSCAIRRSQTIPIEALLVGCCAPASAIWVDGNRITRNGTGVEISAGAVYSRGNNTVEANGVDGAPTATYSPK